MSCQSCIVIVIQPLNFGWVSNKAPLQGQALTLTNQTRAVAEILPAYTHTSVSTHAPPRTCEAKHE